MNDIMQGWALTIVGILVAFTFMAVFILIMVVLKRLFPYKEDVEATQPETAVQNPVALVESNEPDEAVIAAIAAAVAVARARRAPGIGANLLAGRGSWWAANRMAAQQDVDLVRK
jgi:sodium pump decarboxylase gamma subunit